MNWDAIGAMAEMLGAAGVFLSLIYLALQIRGGTQQSRTAMVQAIASDFAQTLDLCANGEIAAILVKRGEGANLSPVEELQFAFTLNRALNIYLAVQHAYDAGQLNEGYYRTICRDVERAASQFPGWGEGMRNLLANFPDEARKELWRSLF